MGASISLVGFFVKIEIERCEAKMQNVGVTGLEPATSRTPCARASQLRHTPTKVAYYSAKNEFWGEQRGGVSARKMRENNP